MNSDWADYKARVDRLRSQSSQTLADFLNIEIDLGFTLVDAAKTYAKSRNLEAYEQAKQHALDAVHAVDHFKDRLPESLRARVESKASELADSINGLVRPRTHV